MKIYLPIFFEKNAPFIQTLFHKAVHLPSLCSQPPALTRCSTVPFTGLERHTMKIHKMNCSRPRGLSSHLARGLATKLWEVAASGPWWHHQVKKKADFLSGAGKNEWVFQRCVDGTTTTMATTTMATTTTYHTILCNEVPLLSKKEKFHLQIQH